MDYLERNLSALKHGYPEFTERLCEAFSDKHLLKQDNGQVSYVHGLSSYPLNLSSGSILVLKESIPPAPEVLLAGVGLGEHLLTLLSEGTEEYRLARVGRRPRPLARNPYSPRPAGRDFQRQVKALSWH